MAGNTQQGYYICGHIILIVAVDIGVANGNKTIGIAVYISSKAGANAVIGIEYGCADIAHANISYCAYTGIYVGHYFALIKNMSLVEVSPFVRIGV